MARSDNKQDARAAAENPSLLGQIAELEDHPEEITVAEIRHLSSQLRQGKRRPEPLDPVKRYYHGLADL